PRRGGRRLAVLLRGRADLGGVGGACYHAGRACISDPDETRKMAPTSHADHDPTLLFASLPGPDRKRTPSDYCYRLAYRNPRPDEPGCALLWEVVGGRLEYQIALERQPSGALRWHCTCADAVYRGEDAPHVCKHVRGLLGLGLAGLSLPALLARPAAAAPRPRTRAVIQLFLWGGPSQHETFDLKPNAPDGVRGEFRPVATRTPGVRITEHLPRLAALSDRY